MDNPFRKTNSLSGFFGLFLAAMCVLSLFAVSGCDQFGGPGSTTTTTLTATSSTTTTTLPTTVSYSMTFSGPGLASNLTVTARAFDKTTRAKIGDDVTLTWNAGASRYEGDMDFDYDYGDVTLLIFGTNDASEQVARAIVEYDVAAGGATIPFTAASKYELRDIGPGGGYVAVDNGSYASDGLGGTWRYVEMAPVESTSNLKWSKTRDEIPGTSEKRIGYGKINTRTIISGRTKDDVPAAWYCDTLDYNGCDDWFLPSYDELVAASSLTGSSIFLHVSSSYWSSSERALDEGAQDAAWYLNSSGNGTAYKNNTTNLFVKAARYF